MAGLVEVVVLWNGIVVRVIAGLIGYSSAHPLNQVSHRTGS